LAPPDSFLRSTSFRLLAWYAAVFGTSVAVLLTIVYWIAIAAIDDQLSDSVERETQVLVELYRGRGIDPVARAIQLRVADLRPPRRLRRRPEIPPGGCAPRRVNLAANLDTIDLLWAYST